MLYRQIYTDGVHRQMETGGHRSLRNFDSYMQVLYSDGTYREVKLLER